MNTASLTSPSAALQARSVSTERCALCLATAEPAEVQMVRCNVRRFRDRKFRVWRCTSCRSLHCEDVPDLAAYYQGYPIRNQALDYFSRAWYRVVLKRLREAGLQRHHTLLDYGCNQGLFLAFLKEQGYDQCVGYDLYVPAYQSTAALDTTYDWVVSLDVIEHDTDPRGFYARLAGMVTPGGRLCIETPNADGIALQQTEDFLHALHMPYHVHILSEVALKDLALANGLTQLALYRRWYMDSWLPGTARRLFETLLMHAGNDIDAGYEPPRIGLFFKHPSLFFHLVFGYFTPNQRRDHMMMISVAPKRTA